MARKDEMMPFLTYGSGGVIAVYYYYSYFAPKNGPLLPGE